MKLERLTSNQGLAFYVSPRLRDLGLPHAFTTRIGGISPAPFNSLNLGVASRVPGSALDGSDALTDTPANLTHNTGLVQQMLGCPPHQIVLVSQVHGAKVHVVGKDGAGIPSVPASPQEGAQNPRPEADALVTERSDVLLSIRVADCVPILLTGQIDGQGSRRVVAAVHAGWRGIVAGVANRTLQVMQERWGIHPGQVVAAIGPCIGPEHYDVGPEVARAFQEQGLGLAVREQAGAKPHIDLALAVAEQLRRAGLSTEAIDRTDRCTYRDEEDFFSHRRDAGRTGRMAAVIALKE